MKFEFYFKYFLLGVLLILAFNYKVFIKTDDANKNTSEKVPLVVTKGDIKESIEVVGSAELVDEQQLGFNIAGTITKINVKAGDNVKKGDIIAEIDNNDALNTIKDAQISLDNAKISLSQLYETPDNSKILSSKNSITTAENNLNIAQKELDNLKISQQNIIKKQLEDIDNSKKELSSSEASLELAKKDLDILIKEKGQNLSNVVSNKNTTIKNAEDSFKSYLVEIEKAIIEADYILGVTEKNSHLNDSYEIYLGAKNSSYKSKASNELSNLIGNFDTLTDKVNNYDYSGDRDKIISLLNEFQSLYNDLYNTEDALFRTGENSISSDTFTQSQIDTIKSNATSLKNTALSKSNSINSTINTLNTLSDTDLITDSNQSAILSKQESIKSQEISISKQQASIDNAQKTYEETLANQKIALKSKEDDIESKKISLEVAKESYEELMEGPTSENVKKQQNSIIQSEIKLANAQKSLDDYKLEAPFDGVVRKIDYMVGDNLKNDTDKYIYLENPNLVEINVKLDQIDVVDVNVGDRAIITFDAYPNEPANAEVTLIDTTPVVTSGVVSYEVSLILNDDTFKKSILSGMTANIEIITQEKNDVLTLNSQAITTKNGKSYVNLLKNKNSDETQEVEVETGMSSDGTTEIVSGLSEGDTVIYEKITFSNTSTTGTSSTTSNKNSFSGGGGFGMGGGMRP